VSKNSPFARIQRIARRTTDAVFRVAQSELFSWADQNAPTLDAVLARGQYAASAMQSLLSGDLQIEPYIADPGAKASPHDERTAWARRRFKITVRDGVPRRDTGQARFPIGAPPFDDAWARDFRTNLIGREIDTPDGGTINTSPIQLIRLFLMPWSYPMGWSLDVIAQVNADREADGSLPAPMTTVEQVADYYGPNGSLYRHPKGTPTSSVPGAATSVPDPFGPLDPITKHTSDRLLWGFTPHPLLRRVGEEPARELRLPLHLGALSPWLADVDVYWDTTGAAPEMNRITWTFAGAAEQGATPADGERWRFAMFIARSVALYSGELEHHIAGSHLLVEQYAIAWGARHADALVERVSGADAADPVFRLLRPFLRDVDGINALADHLVLGRNGVLTRVCGASSQDAARRIATVLGQKDWRGYAPRAAIQVAGHRLTTPYIDAATTFWEGCGRLVDGWFADKVSNPDEVLKIAAEAISGLPADVVPASTPSAPDGWTWLWPSENPAPGRSRYISVPATVDELKALCRYVIFHASFHHTWINDEGWSDGGWPKWAALGLRNVDRPFKAGERFDAERWAEMMPSPADLALQISVGRVLADCRWGVIDARDEVDAGIDWADHVTFDELEVVQRIHAAFEGLPALPAPLAEWRIRINT
jgi:hypothetical protein